MKTKKRLSDRCEWMSQLCECEMNRLHAYLLIISAMGFLLGSIFLITDCPMAGTSLFLTGLAAGAPVVLAMKDNEPL